MQDAEKFVSASLVVRNFMSKTRVYNLNDNLNFGKHMGLTIEYVLEIDPSYLVWAHDNIKWFKLKPEIYQQAEEKSVNQRFKSYLDSVDWGYDPYDYMD